MAHQRVAQIKNPDVLDALCNCAIRYANSDEDAAFLAPRLHTSKDFLQKLKRGRFAAYIRDMTDTAVAITVPKTDFDLLSLPAPTPPAVTMTHGPLVSFNPRPPEMEPWRLDNAYKPKPDPPSAPSVTHSTPAPTRPAAGAGQKSKPTGITEPPKSEPSPAKDDPHTGDHTDPAPEWGDK